MSQEDRVPISVPAAVEIAEEITYDQMDTVFGNCNGGDLRAIAAGIDERVQELMNDPVNNRYWVKNLCYKGRYLLWMANNPSMVEPDEDAEEIDLQDHQQSEGGLLSMRSGVARQVAEQSDQEQQSQEGENNAQQDENEEDENSGDEGQTVAGDGGESKSKDVSNVVGAIKERREDLVDREEQVKEQ